VVQAGTIIGDIHAPPKRQAGRVLLALGGLLVGVAVVLVAVVVVLREQDRGSDSAGPAELRCRGGTHVLDRGPNSICEVDNPAISPAHSTVRWSNGGTTEVVIGDGYRTYYSNNGGPFDLLGNGVANSTGDGVTFHRTGERGGYFTIEGTTRAGYCVDFTVDPDTPERPATRGEWRSCGADQ
jgi:hypothetical protein